MKKICLVIALVVFCYHANFCQTAKEYKESGIIKADSNDFEGAIKDFTLAIQLNSKDDTAYFKRALCYDLLNNYNAALKDYSKAIELNSNDADYYHFRGEVKVSLEDYKEAFNDFIIASKFDTNSIWNNSYETTSIIDKATKINPNLSLPNFYRAYCNFIKEEYQEALEVYNKLFELTPNAKSLYRYRGDVKFFLKDYQGAVEDYTITINEDTKLFANYFFRAKAYYFLKIYDKALSDINTYINNVKTPNESGFSIRSGIREETGDYQGASEDYTKAIEINPSADNYFFRGVCKEENNDYQGALLDYSKAIEINSSDEAYYFFRAICTEKNKDYQGALIDYNKAIEINPNDRNYSRRAKCKEDMKDYAGAIQDYSKALQINPNELDYYYSRAFIKQELNDFKGAVQDYNKSFELSSTYVGYSPQQKDTNSSYSTEYSTDNKLMHQKFIDATNKFFPEYTAIVTNSYANPEQYIRREDNKVMEFENDTTDKNVQENLLTVLHESIHQKNYELSNEYICGYYIGDNQFSQVYFDDSFYPSEDLRLTIDSAELDALSIHQSNLVNTYLFSDVFFSNSEGIYGLLNEFTAYAHGSKAAINQLKCVESKIELKKEFFSNVYDIPNLYYTFNIMIGWYLEHAIKCRPELVNVLNNDLKLRKAYTKINQLFEQQLEIFNQEIYTYTLPSTGEDTIPENFESVLITYNRLKPLLDKFKFLGEAGEVGVPEIEEEEVLDDEEVYTVVDVIPEFKGGVEKMMEYLRDNLKYPIKAKEYNIKGQVVVNFTVGTKGEIKNVNVIEHVHYLLDKEAVRVVKAMPDWTIGLQDGVAVSVLYNIPINFILEY